MLIFNILTRLLQSLFNSLVFKFLLSVFGLIPASNNVSSAYIFPTPATVAWSNKADLIERFLFFK